MQNGFVPPAQSADPRHATHPSVGLHFSLGAHWLVPLLPQRALLVALSGALSTSAVSGSTAPSEDVGGASDDPSGGGG